MPYSHCQTRLDKAVFSRRVAWCELDIRVRVTSREGQISTMAVFFGEGRCPGEADARGPGVHLSCIPQLQCGNSVPSSKYSARSFLQSIADRRLITREAGREKGKTGTAGEWVGGVCRGRVGLRPIQLEERLEEASSSSPCIVDGCIVAPF